MLPDRTISMPKDRPHPRGFRSGGNRLIEAVGALADHGILTEHRETPWASITFAGTRHTMVWFFAGADAVASGELFVATLPEHEFRMPGRLVADASVIEVASRQLPEPSMTVTAEILLLDEA